MEHTATPSVADAFDISDSFTTEFVSAFSEIYNNIPIHAYERGQAGSDVQIELAVTIGPDCLIVELTDTGKSFDIEAVPLPDNLPTGGMGIHIARSMLDELVYRPGPPNRWRLAKYLRPRRGPAEPSIATPQAAE